MEYGKNKALEYALWMLDQGYLSIDGEGKIWRTAAFRRGRWVSITPRRAENVAGKGYLRLTLQVGGKLASVMAHRVVWTRARGAIPQGRQINHKDLNKQNNCLDNLEVVTDAENIQHSYRHGRKRPWSEATEWRGKPRLTSTEIDSIRSDRASGLTYPQLAEKWDISVTHAHRICTSK